MSKNITNLLMGLSLNLFKIKYLKMIFKGFLPKEQSRKNG